MKLTRQQNNLLKFYAQLEDMNVRLGLMKTGKALGTSLASIWRTRKSLKELGLVDFTEQPYGKAEATEVKLTDAGWKYLTTLL